MSDHQDCKHLLSSLSDFVDGDLSPALCEEIEHHMADCENCQIVINTLKKTVELYKQTTETPSIPDDVRSRLYQVLNLETYLENPPAESV